MSGELQVQAEGQGQVQVQVQAQSMFHAGVSGNQTCKALGRESSDRQRRDLSEPLEELSPQMAIRAMVLRQAVEDLKKFHRRKIGMRSPREVKRDKETEKGAISAYYWIRSESNWAFSFCEVCRVLDLDIDDVREALEVYLDGVEEYIQQWC